MKLNILIILIMVCTAVAPVLAGDDQSVQELVPLPHPIKVVMANELELQITPEQMARMKNEVVGFFPPIMLPMMIEAGEMEARLAEEIMGQGKTKLELADEIDKLAVLKRKLIDTHIDSLNTLKSILSDEQWIALRELLAEAEDD